MAQTNDPFIGRTFAVAMRNPGDLTGKDFYEKAALARAIGRNLPYVPVVLIATLKREKSIRQALREFARFGVNTVLVDERDIELILLLLSRGVSVMAAPVDRLAGRPQPLAAN